VRDSLLTLTDGRSISFAEYGRASGATVFYFHGAPSSRLDLVGLEQSLVERDVRVVAPDRPGYGGSTPQPGRSLGDWPDDVAAVADHLQLDRFAVMGMSAGGPYAVASAALLPERVVGLGVVCGVTDRGSWPEAWEDFPAERAEVLSSGEEAVLAWLQESFGLDGSGFPVTAEGLSPPDAALFEDADWVRWMTATINEALGQGLLGWAQDAALSAQPWPFDPGAITVPTWVLHGEQDTFQPIDHGRHTAELISHATFVAYPEHGHLSIDNELPELATHLATLLG
jgi:pimeloyl-ACP methyl ester carboxylesterase